MYTHTHTLLCVYIYIERERGTFVYIHKWERETYAYSWFHLKVVWATHGGLKSSFQDFRRRNHSVGY